MVYTGQSRSRWCSKIVPILHSDNRPFMYEWNSYLYISHIIIISSDLKWNNHVVDCIKKANKRIYFIVLLKRARVPCNDIVDFYCTTIRSVLEYCAPLFHHALPAYLSEDIERIQKRVLSIILPDMSYQDCLDRLGLPTLKESSRLFQNARQCKFSSRMSDWHFQFETAENVRLTTRQERAHW